MKWSKFKRRLKNWKPIHLCWLFGKFGLPIPPYFIGSGSPFDLTGSRIASAARDWQEDEDVDVTSWSTDDDFIVAGMIECTSHNGGSGTIILRWRDVTDSGSFTALSGSGELTWSATTDLVNDNAVTSGEEGCTPNKAGTWQNGIEREGANDCVVPTLDDEYTEHQWAVDCSGADAGHEYEFEIYDSTEGASVGTLLTSITMASVGPTPQLCQLTVLGTASLVATLFANILAQLTVTATTALTTLSDFFRTIQLTVVGTTTCAASSIFSKLCQLTVTGVTGLGNFLIHKIIPLTVAGTASLSRKLSLHKVIPLTVTVAHDVGKNITHAISLTVTATTSATAFIKTYQLCQLAVSATAALGAFTIHKLASLTITTAFALQKNISKIIPLTITATTSVSKAFIKLIQLTITVTGSAKGAKTFMQLCQLTVTIVHALQKKISKTIHMAIGGGGGIGVYPVIGGSHVIQARGD